MSAAKPLAGCRILLVEDEYMIAMDMEDWLLRAGAEVMGPVPSRDQALDLVNEAGRIDGAVLDVNLGDGETSYPVADRLDELHVPYLFATGDVQVLTRPGGQDRVTLAKPVLERDVINTLVRLVRSGSEPD